MKINMTNFIPMLSSSPPPIDDIDSPENDEDEFGIFTAAPSAYDCSFESPMVSPLKNSKSNGDFQRTQVSNKSDNASQIQSKDINCEKASVNQNIEEPINKYNQNGISDDKGVENGQGDLLQLKHSTADVHKIIVESSIPANCTSHITLCNSINHDGSGDFNLKNAECEEMPALKLNCSDTLFVNTDLESTGMPVNIDLEQSEFPIKQNIDSDISESENIPECYVLPADPVSEQRQFISSDSSQDVLPPIVNCDSKDNGQVPDLNLILSASHKNNDECENGDFAEFLDANFCSSELPPVEGSLSKDESKSIIIESDEEFGNFECGEPANCDIDQNTENASDDFADFTSHGFVGDAEFATEEDEFADFENAGPKLESVPLSVPQDSGNGINKISTVLNVVFPISEDNEISATNEATYEVLDQNCRSRRLWERLHELDQLPGLSSQWSVSHSFQQLLRSVNVDYHSILRTSTVPFFASGLGLLEPTKGTAAAAEMKINDKDVHSCDDPIPPVHFDWGSSGLVNPLDSNQAISTLMDITFLNSSANSASRPDSRKDFSFETELLTSPIPDPIPSCPKAPILEQLLSSGAKSSYSNPISSSRPCGLSEETVRVLDQLPNLSFMRAQMLMFPISNDT